MRLGQRVCRQDWTVDDFDVWVPDGEPDTLDRGTVVEVGQLSYSVFWDEEGEEDYPADMSAASFFASSVVNATHDWWPVPLPDGIPDVPAHEVKR